VTGFGSKVVVVGAESVAGHLDAGVGSVEGGAQKINLNTCIVLSTDVIAYVVCGVASNVLLLLYEQNQECAMKKQLAQQA
jgi:hypothetical protein